MKKNSGPSAKPLDSIDAAKKFVNQAGDVNVIGFFPTKNAAAEDFLKSAGGLREDFRFGYVTDQSIADALGVGAGGVALFRSSEKNPEVFSGTGSLSDWIFAESITFPVSMII